MKRTRAQAVPEDDETRPTTDVWADGGAPMAEAVSFSGYGRSKLYELMDAGEIPFAKVGRRRIVARRGLRSFLERSEAAPKTK